MPTLTAYPSISKFQQFVELKDFRPPTKKEYVRYVRKCAEHFACDPLTLTEDQLRQYFLFLRQVKHYSRSPMKAAKFSLRSFFVDCHRLTHWTVFSEVRIAEPIVLPVVLSRQEVASVLHAVREQRMGACLELIYHPHIHYLVPGGGLTPDGLRWKRVADPQFFLSTKVLALRFRNRLRQWLEENHQDWLRQIPAWTWRIDWVADVQPVGRGLIALRYLAAYVQKTALGASRLVACDDSSVTFTHQDRDTGQTRSLRLSGEEFLRRFLQHVLPAGLQRVRHFGWLSAAAKSRWERIHALLDWKPAVPPATQARCGMPECPRCQKPMRLLGPLARPPPWT